MSPERGTIMDMEIRYRRGTLAFIVKDTKVLLGFKHSKAEVGAETLNGPGGKIDPGQTSIECVKKEVLDETGITIQVTKDDQVAAITFNNGKESVWDVDVYLVREFQGEPHDTREMRAVAGEWWYEIDRVPYQTMMLASDGAWIPQVLAGKKFNAIVDQSADGKQLDHIAFAPFQPFTDAT